MKKFFKCLSLIFLIIPACFMFSACNSVTIVDIKKTNTTESSTIYTVYYSDGTTSSMTVENGKDGESLNVEELFNLGVSMGNYTNDLEGYQKFLSDLVGKGSSTQTTNKGVNLALQSVVTIYSKFPVNSHVFPYNESEVPCGAGVIYKMDSDFSYIVTNYHVIYDSNTTLESKLSQDIYIFQYGVDWSVSKVSTTRNTNDYEIGGDYVKGTLVGGAMSYDLAIIKVNTADLIKNNPNAVAAKLADSYKVSQTIYAIGNPEGSGVSITKGIVSVDSEDLQITGPDNSTNLNLRVIRIDAAVNGGNSGGGIFNENGELVGIVNAKRVYENDSSTPALGICYALPIDNVNSVFENLMYYYNETNEYTLAYKLYLGIYVKNVDTNSSQTYNPITGEIVVEDNVVLANDVAENSIAYGFTVQPEGEEKSHLKAGDIFTHFIINNKVYKLDRSFKLGDVLLMVRPGDNVALKINRNNTILTTGAITIEASQLTQIK